MLPARPSGAIGTAVLPGIGTIVGGLIGAIVGVGVDYIARHLVEWGFGYYEHAKRASLVVEAFHFLELPGYHLISVKVVEARFRKLALECHPDSPRVQAKDAEGQAIAELQWELLQHAKDVALGYLKNEDKFSRRCRDTIQKNYKTENRETCTFNQLRESLKSPTTSEKQFLV